MLCALVTSTDLEKTFDVAKITGGVGTPLGKSTNRSWFVANRSPVIRADHHQCTKVPPIPEDLERTLLLLFPLI
jgi:hypothetical protein